MPLLLACAFGVGYEFFGAPSPDSSATHCCNYREGSGHLLLRAQDNIHYAKHGRVSTKHKRLSETLISVADIKNQRRADQLLASIRPQLEQTEQRLASKIAQATVERFGSEPTTQHELQLEPEPEHEI